MTDTKDVETLALPLSGLHLQWRPTAGECRILKAEYATDPERAAEFDWVPLDTDDLSVAAYRNVDPELTSAVFGSWRRGDPNVRVVLADGTTPNVHTIGPMWAAEWSAPRQPATILRLGLPPVEITFGRPDHLGPDTE